MEKLITYETDRGRYAVRPMSWAGIWNEKGRIKESLNHLALFIEKEDAEKFVEWKTAEEQKKLLKLPCAVGDTVYVIEVDEENFTHFHCPRKISEYKFNLQMLDLLGMFGKCIFLTKEEAEAALKEA